MDPKVPSETVRRLVHLLREPTPAELCRDLLQCLWNTTCDHAQKEVAIDCEVVFALLPFLNGNNLEIKRLAIGVLCMISVAENGKKAIIASPECLERLCATAKNTTSSGMRDNAVVTLQQLTDLKPGLEAIGKTLLIEFEVLTEVLNPDQTARLIDLLFEDPKLGESTLFALASLVKTKLGCRAVWENMLRVVRRVNALCSPDSSERVQGLARHTLEALCKENPEAQAELLSLRPKDMVAKEAAAAREIANAQAAAAAAAAAEVELRTKPRLDPAETAILLVMFQNDFTTKVRSKSSFFLVSINFC